jgi:K+-sensing histidine kinase KdpD
MILGMRMQLPVLPDQHPMLVLFVPAILLTALAGGLGPMLVATACTAIVVNIFLLPPYAEFAISAPHDVLQLMVLILSGILAGVIGEMQRRARPADRCSIRNRGRL